VHGLELGADLLQRAVRGSRLDASNQPDQAIAAPLWPGTVQQAVLNEALETRA